MRRGACHSLARILRSEHQTLLAHRSITMHSLTLSIPLTQPLSRCKSSPNWHPSILPRIVRPIEHMPVPCRLQERRFAQRPAHELAHPLDSGVKLEIVNTTVAFGGRTVSAVTEVRPLLISVHL